LKTAAYVRTERRLAIHRVNVGTASVDDLVRYYRISCLITTGMDAKETEGEWNREEIIKDAAKRKLARL